MNTVDLRKYGILGPFELIHNPSYEDLFLAEIDTKNEGFERAQLTHSGAVAVETGIFTGRSPKDRYIVRDAVSEKNIWWDGNINKSVSTETWTELKQLTTAHLSHANKIYVVDAFCGTHINSRLKVRFIVEVAWQAHYVTNMFIRPTKDELKSFGEPDFVSIAASKATNPNWQRQGLNSDVYILFNLTEKMQIIGGTWYGGELKKGIFSMMNYYLPLKGIASMHCSANVGEKGDVALFFGLSGTGKTTLSADPKRYLIGDDEHGWDEEGVFNFEGGCYAKTLQLSEENEPEIWNAIQQNALLENVRLREDGSVDFSDTSLTENGRVSYPIYHIKKCVLPSEAGPAKKIIFLSADAFGVLPPVSLLDREQAKYHFLCGYTSKIAGTERGITIPVPSFSPAFGEAFLTLHPLLYAEILAKKMDEHQAKAYLVNTGWNGSGKRISLKDTRAIIDAILDDSIEEVETSHIPILNLSIPNTVKNVEISLLDPRNTYKEIGEWEKKAKDLAQKYIENFAPYSKHLQAGSLEKVGPQL